MIVDAFALKGKIKDVCAELEEEAKRCKRITVGEWLHQRRVEEAMKLGISVEELRRKK